MDQVEGRGLLDLGDRPHEMDENVMTAKVVAWTADTESPTARRRVKNAVDDRKKPHLADGPNPAHPFFLVFV